MFFQTFFDSFELSHPEVISILYFPFYQLAHCIRTILALPKQPPEVFCRKSCSQKFRNIHREILVLECLFNKIAGLQVSRKRLQHRCFPGNIAKVLRTPILKKICERLLLNFEKGQVNKVESVYVMHYRNSHPKMFRQKVFSKNIVKYIFEHLR